MGRKRVLVIDESPEILGLVAAVVGSDPGYDVLAFSDVVEALVAAREAPPDAVVLGLMVRSRRGEAVHRALRTDPRTARIPIVLCTAQGAHTVRRRLKGAPDLLVTKPFHPRELLEAVEDAVARAPEDGR